MSTFEKNSISTSDLVEILKNLDPKKHILWVLDEFGSYLYISKKIPLKVLKTAKKEQMVYDFIEEERFGQKVSSFKIPLEINNKKFIIGFSLLDHNALLNSLSLSEINKVLGYLDNEEINMYVKSEDHQYTFLSKGCMPQFKEFALRDSRFDFPIKDEELFDKEKLKYLREKDSKVFNSGKTIVHEEKLPGEKTKNFLSVKIPFSIPGKKLLFGYSVEIDSYINKITDYKLEIFDLKKRIFGKNYNSLEHRVSGLTHDISAPLNSTIQMLEILKLTESNTEKLKYLNSSTFTLHSIKNTIRMLISEEFLQKDINDEIIFKEIEDLIYGLYMLTADSKKIKLKVEKDKSFDKRPVVMFKDKVFRILINLVNNSLKYTNTGYVSLKLSQMFDMFVIEVKDTGQGFENLTLIKIRTGNFDEFKKIREDSGFGWNLIYNYINYLGGGFFIQNLKKGSKVTIMLPMN